MQSWRTGFTEIDQGLSEVSRGLFVSGEMVMESGIYRVEHAGGNSFTEAVLIRGSRLPLCAECQEPLLFWLTRTVPHLSEDEDFSSNQQAN